MAASFVSDPKNSTVADKVGYALAPDNGLGKRGNWLWAWSLAVPAGTQKADAAQKFVVLGDQQGLPRPRRVEGGLGQRSSGHAHLALQQCRIPEGGALREADARLDQLGRPDQADGQAGALCRACSSSPSPSSRVIGTTVGQLFLGGARRADPRWMTR